MMMIMCPNCGGEGVDLLNTEETICPECDGEGTVDIECGECHAQGCPECDHMGAWTVTCSCDGSGEVWKYNKCNKCNGIKWIPNPDVFVE